MLLSVAVAFIGTSVDFVSVVLYCCKLNITHFLFSLC